MTVAGGQSSNHEFRAAIAGAVVGGVLAFGASYVIGSQQIDAARETTQQQIDAAREQTKQQIDAQTAIAERDKRATVYSDYLQAAQGWADKRYEHVLCNCVPQEELFSAFNELRRQDVNVGIWGTPEARTAELALARTIPDSWPENSTKGGEVDRTKPFDLRQYAEASKAFIAVMCDELPTVPNPRC